MADTEKETDEKRFNETVQRMLKTPPKPHEKASGEKNVKPANKELALKPKGDR